LQVNDKPLNKKVKFTFCDTDDLNNIFIFFIKMGKDTPYNEKSCKSGCFLDKDPEALQVQKVPPALQE